MDPNALQGIGQGMNAAVGGMQQQGPMDQIPPAPPAQLPQGSEPEGMDERDKETLDINKMLESTNLADTLEKEDLQDVYDTCKEGYLSDRSSRKEWEKKYDEWVELAMQVSEVKTYPWPKASNVKYPLLATAAMQFAARAYPSLVPADGQVVKARVVGLDKDGAKAQRADRIGKHMSYQLMAQMDDWEEDMDKLLVTLPIIGTVFKKTYWDSLDKVNCSKLVFPKNLVVNYWAKSIEGAERKTEILYLSKREIQERMNEGIYTKFDLNFDPDVSQHETEDHITSDEPDEIDDATPYMVLEQHTFYDVDEDDYPEPVIVTFMEQTNQVLRILPRFEKEGVKTRGGKLVKIEPIEYYTKFSFVPNPDGGFYDIGFGHLLGPINSTVDTIVNQLVDAGTLSNLQSGFIAKGLRLKMGETRFQPGEWKAVNATGDDLKKSVFPMPVRDPSPTLFNLLTMLITAGKELASVAEIFVGKMPGQNTPATTTQSTIEQGSKLFTSIYKRIYRSLTKEFKKIYRLNRMYMEEVEEVSVLDEPMARNDYAGPADDIMPAADPAGTSSVEKQQRAGSLLQLVQLGTLDTMEVTKRILDAQEQPNATALLNTKPAPPNPEMVKAQADAQAAQQKAQFDQQKLQLEQQKNQLHGQIETMKAQVQMEQMKSEAASASLLQAESQAKQQLAAANVELAKLKVAQTQAQAMADQRSAQMDMMGKAHDMKLKEHAAMVASTAKAHDMHLNQQKLKQDEALAKRQQDIKKNEPKP